MCTLNKGAHTKKSGKLFNDPRILKTDKGKPTICQACLLEKLVSHQRQANIHISNVEANKGKTKKLKIREKYVQKVSSVSLLFG